jgi:urease accessory protein
MLRATRVLRAEKSRPVADTVVLDYDQRHRRRMAMTGSSGVAFLLDLAEAVPLRDGDGLELEDGRIVAVRAAPEPLAEIRAANAAELLRVAWHLGNRHLPAELRGDLIRIRRDHVIEHMVEGLGAAVTHIDAPFDPEGGAYAGGGHHHQAAEHHHEHHKHDDRLEEDEGSA